MERLLRLELLSPFRGRTTKALKYANEALHLTNDWPKERNQDKESDCLKLHRQIHRPFHNQLPSMGKGKPDDRRQAARRVVWWGRRGGEWQGSMWDSIKSILTICLQQYCTNELRLLSSGWHFFKLAALASFGPSQSITHSIQSPSIV